MGKVLQSTFVLLLFSWIASAQGASSAFAARLAEADRLAWLTNWYDALPIYTEVERAASKCRQSPRRDVREVRPAHRVAGCRFSKPRDPFLTTFSKPFPPLG